MTPNDKRMFYRTLAKRFLFQAQEGRCHICGQKLPERFGSPLLTIDHVWPASKSEAHDKFRGNVLLAHLRCNQAKGDRLPTRGEVTALHMANRRMGLPVGETWFWDGQSAKDEVAA